MPTDEQCLGKGLPPGIGIPGGYEEVIKEKCFRLRSCIEDLKYTTKSLMGHGVFIARESHRDQHSEMKANIMLAYRHLEDARMRLGKVVQAYDGGKSVYPK